MTRVGRCTCSMVQAMVALLPLPVMPRRVWKRSPRWIPSARAATARGWSPAGAKSETTLNGGGTSVRSYRPTVSKLDREKGRSRRWPGGFPGLAESPHPHVGHVEPPANQVVDAVRAVGELRSEDAVHAGLGRHRPDGHVEPDEGQVLAEAAGDVLV